MPKIPALTMSGGRLSEFGGLEAAKEFRVWVHPSGGDDYYYVWKTLAGAKKGHTRLLKSDKYRYVEKVIAVVWDKRYKKYREVAVDKAALK